ncbi:hypothetical protein M2480_001947, partial [Parabacteroides sp. PFB2-12]|nr:hypothetical protein [Parabacteroides sp. PFB2-12]
GGIPLIITNEPGMGSTLFGVAWRVGLVYLPTTGLLRYTRGYE